MPSEKSARVAEGRRLRNQPLHTRAKSYVAKAMKLVEEGQRQEAEAAVQAAFSALDRAAQKGVIHPNNASRRKSRIAARFKKAFEAQAASS